MNSKTVLQILSMVALTLVSSRDAAFAQAEYILSSRTNADTTAVRSVVEPVLHTIPTAIRDAVFGNGCRIMVVPTVSEYMGMGYSDKPRGYTDGGGYDNADGLFVPAQNQLLVSEKVSYRSSVPGKAWRIPYVVRHEFGHAYDYYLGHHYKQILAVSQLPKFTETHANEVQRLTNSSRANLSYFCQSGAAGSSETFAELFCMHCELPSEWSEQQKALSAAFPLTDELVKTAMNSPEAVLRWDQQ
jgi:hypothetical protein